jgi:hypothetical protein
MGESQLKINPGISMHKKSKGAGGVSDGALIGGAPFERKPNQRTRDEYQSMT